MSRFFIASAVLLASSCATTSASSGALTAKNDTGALVYSGSASWTVRATSSGREDVIQVPDLGEVIALDQRRCRLVRPEKNGGMTVWEATTAPRCIETREDKVCFTSPTTFAFESASFVVAGCADRNDVFLSRIDGSVPATVGPRAFIERCAPVDSERLRYIRVVDIHVDNNDRPKNGLRFRTSGEDFEVCFLVREQGSYRVLLELEDPQPREVTLQGKVDEL